MCNLFFSQVLDQREEHVLECAIIFIPDEFFKIKTLNLMNKMSLNE